MISPGKSNKRRDFLNRKKIILIIATLLYGIFGIGMYGVMTKSIIYTLLSLALLLVVRVSSIFVFIRSVYHHLSTMTFQNDLPKVTFQIDLLR